MVNPFLKKISAIYTYFGITKESKTKVSLFNPGDLVNVYSSDMSNWAMLSHYDSIDEYIAAIQRFMVYIKKDEPIPQYLLPLVERKVYVAEFFTHKNKYVNVTEKAKEFLDTVTELFELLDNLEQLDEKPEYGLRNLRLISIIRANIKSIVGVFNDQGIKTLR